MSTSIETIISELFEIDPSELTDAHSPDQIGKWDSMNHLKLITAIENAYEIKLSMQEIQTMLSIGTIKKVVDEHESTK